MSVESERQESMDKMDNEMISKISQGEININGAHLAKILSNRDNVFHIMIEDLELTQTEDQYIVLINEEQDIQKFFFAKLLDTHTIEFEINDSLFLNLKNLYNKQMWKLAIGYSVDGNFYLKRLKDITQITEIRDQIYDWSLSLYYNINNEQTSLLQVGEQKIALMPFYHLKGHMSLCTVSEKLLFYRDRQYGISDFQILENKLLVEINLPKETNKLKGVYLLAENGSKIEIGKYQVSYEVVKETEKQYSIVCNVDLNHECFYLDIWHLYLEFYQGDHSVSCPILIAIDVMEKISRKQVGYESDSRKITIDIKDRGIFSITAEMDIKKEKGFLLKNAQKIEESEDKSLENLIEDNILVVKGSIHAKMQVTKDKKVHIKLLNDSLAECSEYIIFLEKYKELHVIFVENQESNYENNEIVFECPTFGDKISTYKREVWKLCLVAKVGETYFNLRLQDREFLEKIQTNKKKKIYYNKLAYYLEQIAMENYGDVPIAIIPFHVERGHMSIMTVEENKKYVCQIMNEVKRIFIRNGKIVIKVRCHNVIGDLKGFKLAYRYKRREDIEEYFIPATKIREKKRYIDMEGVIDINEIDFHSIYWDIFGVFEYESKEYQFEFQTINVLYRLSFLRLINNNNYVNKNNFILFPYLTLKRSISLQFREKNQYDGAAFRLKERIALILYFILKPYLRRKKILISYEKYSYLAQDNSYYFFKYCMENNMEEYMEREIYYVIDKKSPDWPRVAPYEKNLLDFMSLKYMVYLLASTLMVSSDTKTHAYVWRSKGSVLYKFLKAKKVVFLQHGVTSFKKVDKVYARNTKDACNLFIVTSNDEYNIVRNHFKYRETEIAITGFARWDALIDKSADRKEILLMPTWRNWLDDIEEEIFIKSDYYKNYTALLSSEKLRDILERYDITLNFYVHPKFMDYISSFHSDSDRIRIIMMGEEPLNQLMMQCKLLITDYSSVAWDVYYQGKPVLFYQFDIDTYQEAHGSYIDFEKELFGNRTQSLEELIDYIEENCKNDFMLEEKYVKQRKRCFKYVDQNNSKRICEAIVERGL